MPVLHAIEGRNRIELTRTPFESVGDHVPLDHRHPVTPVGRVGVRAISNMYRVKAVVDDRHLEPSGGTRHTEHAYSTADVKNFSARWQKPGDRSQMVALALDIRSLR